MKIFVSCIIYIIMLNLICFGAAHIFKETFQDVAINMLIGAVAYMLAKDE